jgi:hypothetical protein
VCRVLVVEGLYCTIPRVPQCLSLRPIGSPPPPPLLQSNVSPPLEPKAGGGNIRRLVWGWGGQFRRLERKPGTLYTLWFILYTLNLSLLNLEHVIYKQLQMNLKYAFKFVFLFHVLILKAEKQLLPRCKPLFVIWIQGIVNLNLIYTCSCYTYLCCAQPLLPPPPLHQAV